MCEIVVQLEEKAPGNVGARVYIRDGEGVTDAERHAAVGLSENVNRTLHVAALRSSFDGGRHV